MIFLSSIRRLTGYRWTVLKTVSSRRLYSQVRVCVKPSEFSNTRNYDDYEEERIATLQARLGHADRYQSITSREDRSSLSMETIRDVHCSGRFLMTYRGCKIMKSPDDQALYHQLFWYLRPATVIELGSFSGGSGLWIADTLNLMSLDCNVYSMDINLSFLEPQIKELQPSNLHFIQGDCHAIEETFTKEWMNKMKHPLVVIDDAHTNFTSVLAYFHKFMAEGDYFIVEDTNPDLPDVCCGGTVHPFRRIGTRKLSALRNFLTEYEEWYAVDSFYTDFFGYNGTWNWHGFIRRMK